MKVCDGRLVRGGAPPDPPTGLIDRKLYVLKHKEMAVVASCRFVRTYPVNCVQREICFPIVSWNLQGFLCVPVMTVHGDDRLFRKKTLKTGSLWLALTFRGRYR